MPTSNTFPNETLRTKPNQVPYQPVMLTSPRMTLSLMGKFT